MSAGRVCAGACLLLVRTNSMAEGAKQHQEHTCGQLDFHFITLKNCWIPVSLQRVTMLVCSIVLLAG